MSRPTNRLIKEKSPYLLQHAHNPVDWYPWGDTAFEKAKSEDKLVFLSVGYSTCHWCHVMERESFEDEEVAAVLNRDFVAVKVDREERPDIDHIYMTVCQVMTGEGGWPLTVIMTPDQKPFFAGTYFPKTNKYGRPGLLEILERIGRAWKQDRESAIETGNKVARVLKKYTADGEDGELTEQVIHQAYKQLAEQFDAEYGGFGPAPKFPRPHDFLFLLRYWKQMGEDHALHMVEKSLDAMHRGGIYDQLGYGFARYSVDREWLVPHFEKMLYDNALLALAYLEAYQVTGKKGYAQVSREIFTYVLRDMTSPEGGFYSAEDADSEGEEGKFYVWTQEEVVDLLGEELGALFCEYYHVTATGNFEHGRSILHWIDQSKKDVAGRWGITEEELEQKLEFARQKLFTVRERRVHPHKDDKVLTSWNGLMIAAFARGARVLGEERYAEAAKRAIGFIKEKLLRPDGRLLARYRDGEAAFPAYLDDYAFLVWGLLEMYETTFQIGYLQDAVQLTEAMIDSFGDEESGGFYFYGKDAEQLLIRPKEVYDGAMPSGNGVAAHNLIRLARMTQNERFDGQVEHLFRTFAQTVEHSPGAHTYLLTALQFALGPTKEIVIVGQRGTKDTEAMLKKVQTAFLPDAVLLFRPEREKQDEVERMVPFIKGQQAVAGKATAYVCKNYACQAPTTDLQELTEFMQ